MSALLARAPRLPVRLPLTVCAPLHLLLRLAGLVVDCDRVAERAVRCFTIQH